MAAPALSVSCAVTVQSLLLPRLRSGTRLPRGAFQSLPGSRLNRTGRIGQRNNGGGEGRIRGGKVGGDFGEGDCCCGHVRLLDLRFNFGYQGFVVGPDGAAFVEGICNSPINLSQD